MTPEEQAELNNALARSALHNNIEDMKSLIKRGADPNAQSELFKKNTALTLATGANKLKAVELLIKTGADVNIKNGVGSTALHIALREYSYNNRMVEALIKAGADINAQNSKRETPLDIAKSKGDEFYNPFIDFLTNLINETSKAEAFAMGTHDRLGAESSVKPLIPDLIRKITEKAAPARMTLDKIPEGEHLKAVLDIAKSKGDEFYNPFIDYLAKKINIDTQKAKAFAMGTHPRLGAESPVYTLNSDVVKEIVQKAAMTLDNIPEEHRNAVQKRLNELQEKQEKKVASYAAKVTAENKEEQIGCAIS